jgi:hypothetical protein
MAQPGHFRWPGRTSPVASMGRIFKGMGLPVTIRWKSLLVALACALLCTATPAVVAGAAVAPVGRANLLGCARVVHPGWATCDARMLLDSAGRPLSDLTGVGYAPTDLRSAYGLTSASATGGVGQTIAVVEAFNDPSAESDLAVYRSHFGLPVCGSGCFRVVNQSGAAGPYSPTNNQGWASEESLDLDMVSAICPNCHILVVEANDQGDDNLGEAVDTAARLGANAISNSFGSPESTRDQPLDRRYFDHPGIAVTASAGDSGYGVEYPAASPYVTAVGGTALKRSANARGWTETAWRHSGSGCSAYEPKPTWQTDSGCPRRTVADVSIDAAPKTGVAAYDTDCSLLHYLESICFRRWGVVGGTSVGAPVIAAIYGLAGNSTSVDGAKTIYAAGPGALNDVTSGSDGTCTPSYICTAGIGYDGPTGLGTPDGTGAF